MAKIKAIMSATAKPESHTDLYHSFDPDQRDFRNHNLCDVILKFARGKNLIDVGCGYGQLLTAAQKLGFTVEGVEPDPALVALAAKRHPLLKIHAADATEFAPSELYDTVVSVDILECMLDYHPTLKAISRFIKPGGRLILVVPAHPALFGSRDQLMGYFRRFSTTELVDALQALGLTISHTRHWNMLLVLPYLILYKLLGKRQHYEQLRSNQNKNRIASTVGWLLDQWFQIVENRLNFGLGLSLIVVADKPHPLL